MSVMWAARMARPDLLKAVQALACFLAHWDRHCDKAIHRLFCYINCTYHHRHTAWIGDDMSSLSLHVYADADFAGCRRTQKSTSGGHMCLEGERSYFPLANSSKRQSAVSQSTPEAEIVAADHALRILGVSALDIWELIFNRHPVITFHDDN